MEPAEVPEDPSITLARKINLETRQNRRVKEKTAKEDNLKKQLAAGGPSGGDGHEGHGGRGGRHGRGGRRLLGSPTLQIASWPEPYKSPYHYAAKQLGTPADMVPYNVNVNTAPIFSDYSLSQLVRAQCAAGEKMGARTLFAVVPRAGQPAYDADREMLNIMHDGCEGGGGGYEDVQVEASDLTQSDNYQQQQLYTQTAT